MPGQELASLSELTMTADMDCFRCLPHYVEDLRTQYNLQLSLIAKSSLLSDLLTQITGHQIPVKQIDNTLWKKIDQADYALS